MLGKLEGENYSEKFTRSIIKLNKSTPMEEVILMLLLRFRKVN